MSLTLTNHSTMNKEEQSGWLRKTKSTELLFLIPYALVFYIYIIHRSLLISQEHYTEVYGLRPGWLMPRYLNDVSDAQWRNFRGNVPVLTVVFAIFSLVANMSRAFFHFKARGMSIVWLLISLIYLLYLHGACVIYILAIASMNFLLVKVLARNIVAFPHEKINIFCYIYAIIFARGRYFPFVYWFYNIFFLLCNRVYEGYPFSMFGQHFVYLDNFRGTFRWHICFNFVVLRMISFGYDYHWAHQDSRFDYEKHIQRCHVCKSGKTCYQCLQDRSLQSDKFSFSIYLCYLVFAPLYIAGPILSFKAFASQLDAPQNSFSLQDLALYGVRWLFCLLLMEVMTHLFYYNAFAISSAIWERLSPVDVFIIGYGVLNFMWLKFSLLWRYFWLWSLICGIESPENMPRCINNCYNLESFWKNWHASFNKWLVRYIYIPLGGSQKKLLNIWVVFTFVAIWHDLEWKLLSWAWLTCLFFIPEMIFKSAANAFKAKGAMGGLVHRELSAVAGAVTITCLMVANLVGFVIGPSGINWLTTRFLKRDGLPVLCGMFISFYIGTKIMFHIQDFKKTTV